MQILSLLNTPLNGRRPGRRHRLWAAAGGLLLTLLLTLPSARSADEPSPPDKPKNSKFRDFDEVVKGTERFEGLFDLYRTNEHLYAEIKASQLNQPLIVPIAIARGMAMAGQPLNFGDEWIIVFRRVDDKVQVVRQNIHYQAPKGSPLAKAVEQNYTDSVIMAIPIVSTRGGSVLVDFAQIFLNDFAGLRIGNVDRNRSTWHKIKAFPKNVELQVEVTYGGRGSSGFSSGFGDDGVADPRGLTLVIHYSLAKLPAGGYKSRLADHRVGQFISATKDFGSKDQDTAFVRHINRWRLEKANREAKLSPPTRQIIWWVEDTVPHEFRPYVEEGILEWNKAFEKIGFRNALAVRWQAPGEEFEPEDINYCTLRWITTSSTFAMSGLRANPLTGEIIDGDVIFDASWIRVWQSEYAFLVGTPTGQGDGAPVPLAVGEIISPIMAARFGYGLPVPLPGLGLDRKDLPEMEGLSPMLVPSQWSPLQIELSRRLGNRRAACQYVSSKQYELSMAAMSLAAVGKADPGGKMPEEFIGQAIKEIIMHEVGHSLGLRHNFKASAMLEADQLNDVSLTRSKGMSGSVMDYNPINIAPKGQTQGDWATTTIGPYDYWAIEYAYKPIDGDETAELKKIAARSPESDLAYATDEDMFMSNDPLVNTYDLGSDTLRYGRDRIALAESLMSELDELVVQDGESWARLRRAFSVLLGQHGNAAYLASSYIGGQSVNRDFKGENGRDPITPVSGAKQREALRFLVDKVLSDDSFDFDPQLLRRLTVESWYHWGSNFFFSGDVSYPVYDRILSIQRIVLNHCFDGRVLSRVQNQHLQVSSGSNPLTIAEIFSALTDGIWKEVAEGADGKREKVEISTVRRNLQREHLRRLCSMVMGSRGSSVGSSYGYVMFFGGSSAPADAKSLARMHLTDLQEKMGQVLQEDSLVTDDTVRAHLIESRDQIKKVLDRQYTASDL